MSIYKKLLPLLFCAALLPACDEPIQHPIVGTWEGTSENEFGLVAHQLTLESDSTYRWKQSYIGLTEIFDKRNPDAEWKDIGIKVTGVFAVAADEVILSPKESEIFQIVLSSEGEELFGESDANGGWPVFKKGHDYIHPYYFDGADLVIVGNAGDPITFTRK